VFNYWRWYGAGIENRLITLLFRVTVVQVPLAAVPCHRHIIFISRLFYKNCIFEAFSGTRLGIVCYKIYLQVEYEWRNIRPLYSNICPTRCNVTQFILSGNCSTCFGWYNNPSSGALTVVSTASGICHTVTAICRYSGR
jgi:hypothetical protein